jgi:predicted Fe-S protein YdhL (DUF1289 family)
VLRGNRTIAFRAFVRMFAARPPRAMPMQSPCNRICTIEPNSGLCRGCGRTLTEIAEWTTLTDAARTRVMAELRQRLARMGAQSAAAKSA